MKPRDDSDPKLDLIREWAENPYVKNEPLGRGSFADWLGFVRFLLDRLDQVTAQAERWKAKSLEDAARLETAKKEALEEEWREIRQWKPYLHFCPEWDFLLIDKGDAEFEACSCFGRDNASETQAQ